MVAETHGAVAPRRWLMVEFAALYFGAPLAIALFLPPAAERGPVPVLLCLAGLTCNEETFAIKAGAQRM